MISEFAAFAQAQASSAARRAAAPLIFAAIAVLLTLFALAALFAALFFWLAPARGQVVAALIVAAVAVALALIALAPLVFRRRAPPPQTGDALPQFVSLMAQAAPSLGPRQLLAAAAAIAVALILSGRPSKR